MKFKLQLFFSASRPSSEDNLIRRKAKKVVIAICPDGCRAVILPSAVEADEELCERFYSLRL